MDRIGRRSVLTCPDCNGVMWEIDDGGVLRYRCHVGHAYAAELMSIALDENLSRALASALRTLDERIALAEKLHKSANENGRVREAASWAEKAREFQREADVIRKSVKRLDEVAAASAQSAQSVESTSAPALTPQSAGRKRA
jgi:two-component system chemotaxis response regulator CheB